GRHDRIAIAEFGGVLRFHGNAGVLLDHQLADESRMPARAARRNDDMVEAEEFVAREIESPELRESLIEDEATAHRVLDGLRLLEDLLQHEVIEAAFLDLVEIPIDAADPFAHPARVEVQHLVSVAREHTHLAIVQIDD